MLLFIPFFFAKYLEAADKLNPAFINSLRSLSSRRFSAKLPEGIRNKNIIRISLNITKIYQAISDPSQLKNFPVWD